MRRGRALTRIVAAAVVVVVDLFVEQVVKIHSGWRHDRSRQHGCEWEEFPPTPS